MLKINTVKTISVQDWDNFVMETYGRPYNFQQQDGCKGRGSHYFEVPLEDEPYDYENDTIPEVVNHEDRGVSFKAWLARDPKQLLTDPDSQNSWSLGMWWSRNFYPTFEMVVEDLQKKGLLEEGEYMIIIDW